MPTLALFYLPASSEIIYISYKVTRDDATIEDWVWFLTQTERMAKMYYKMRKGVTDQMSIIWSVLVKMNSDQENKDSYYKKESRKVIRVWTLQPA